MTAAEDAMKAHLVEELIAEGMIERQAETLVAKQGARLFMVELRVLDVTE